MTKKYIFTKDSRNIILTYNCEPYSGQIFIINSNDDEIIEKQLTKSDFREANEVIARIQNL